MAYDQRAGYAMSRAVVHHRPQAYLSRACALGTTGHYPQQNEPSSTWCPPLCPQASSGGVQSLHDVGDLLEYLLAFAHETLDLFNGMNDRGVIAPTEKSCYRRVAEIGEVPKHVHSYLPGSDEGTLATFSAKGFDGEAQNRRHIGEQLVVGALFGHGVAEQITE